MSVVAMLVGIWVTVAVLTLQERWPQRVIDQLNYNVGKGHGLLWSGCCRLCGCVCILIPLTSIETRVFIIYMAVGVVLCVRRCDMRLGRWTS